MSGHNSVRYFLDDCSLCHGIQICEGFWYPNLSDPATDYDGILSVRTHCLQCKNETETIRPPHFVGGVPNALKALLESNNQGVPYSVRVGSIMPENMTIDITLYNRQQ